MTKRIDILSSAQMLRKKDDDGIVREQLVPTRYMDEHGKRYFAVATTYAFPINHMTDMMEDNGSVTVLRVTVKEGTEEQEGYAALREFIKTKLHMCPAAVCLRLGFHEVIGVTGIKPDETVN